MLRRVRGVAAVEGEQSGDGRVVVADATTWVDPPLPFAWLEQEQHGNGGPGAVQVGTVDTLTRSGSDILWGGAIDDEIPEGAEMVRRMEAGSAPFGNRWGVSIDTDDYAVEVVVTNPDDTEDEEVVLVASGVGTPPLVVAAAGDPDPGDGGEVVFEDALDSAIMRFTRLRVRGLTACAIPAFAGAYMELDDAAPAEKAAEGEVEEEALSSAVDLAFFEHAEVHDATDRRNAAIADAFVAAAPVRPPAAWFRIPEPQPGMSGMVDVFGMPAEELLVEQPDGGLAVPLTITDDGRVFGHAARWGQCHVGYPGACVTPPESAAAYAHFHHGQVVCADGATVATGTLTVGCDHAPTDMAASGARDHYANSGLGWADVRASNGELGVWVSGVVRPGVSDSQLRVLRALSLSGDWRRMDGRLEFIAALSVNVPGFPIAREAVTASGLQVVAAARPVPAAWLDDGQQVSLVAAGVVSRCAGCAERARGEAFTAELLAGLADGMTRIEAAVERLDRRTRHLIPQAIEASAARFHRADRDDGDVTTVIDVNGNVIARLHPFAARRADTA